MPKKIAFIDDDAFHAGHFTRAMEVAGYAVVRATEPPEWDTLLALKGRAAPDMFIVDLHMPHEGRYAQEVGEDIAHTGFYLARDIRKRFPSRPIIFFSSYPRAKLEEMARRSAKGIGNAICLDKHEVSPIHLIDQIDFYFKHTKFRRSVWERLRDAFIARPSFAGIGVDLTKL
jgi:CheY-like chemotaxis protein